MEASGELSEPVADSGAGVVEPGAPGTEREPPEGAFERGGSSVRRRSVLRYGCFSTL
jgi:hypothetical protein